MVNNTQMVFPPASWEPCVINTLEDTGLSAGFVQNLVLKLLYQRGQLTGHLMAETINLPFQRIVSPALDFLKREQMCEVKGAGSLGPASYEYVITTNGMALWKLVGYFDIVFFSLGILLPEMLVLLPWQGVYTIKLEKNQTKISTKIFV